MKMKRCAAAILLMLSLQALAAGRVSAAAAADGVDTIRLPSHGLADEIVTAARATGGSGQKRPWKCCDVKNCNRKMPPGCRCMDRVERCDDACERCEVSQLDPSKHICMDRYTGYDSGPSCTNSGNGIGGGGHDVERLQLPTLLQEIKINHHVGVTATEAVSQKSVVDGEADASPWKCCDKAWCTRSMPPICHCNDEVKKCAKNCKVCEKADKSNAASSRYICRDSYGKPGPPCTKTVPTDVSRGN